MLYKINRNGFIVNEASKKKIKFRNKKILDKTTDLYQERFGKNLLNVYVRGSVSLGRDIPFLSDLDSIAIIKKKISPGDKEWIVEISKFLEKKYPRFTDFDLTIVTLDELLKSKKYSNLRICLKTLSVCLYGKDILFRLPKVKPGKSLGIQMYKNLRKELIILRKLFSGA